MKVVWFRRDLRTLDNTALLRAIDTGEPVLALYVASPEQWQTHHMSPAQSDLIKRRLVELNHELDALNIPLLYQQVATFDDMVDLLAEVVSEYHCDEVFANKEYEVNEVLRDEKVAEHLTKHQVKWRSFDDKCLLKPGAVLNKQGEYFKVFTPYKKAWLKQYQPPVIEKTSPATEHRQDVTQWRYHGDVVWDYPVVDTATNWPVQTREILAALRQFCRQESRHYHQRRDFPSLDATSRLSAYLAIGALSARQCVARLFYESHHSDLNEGQETWLSELIWREFYQHLLFFEPKLVKGQAFLPWETRIQWRQSEAWLTRWQQGKTGYPIVDAAMRQLNQDYWMHNRLRMVVASFLVKDLQLDWRLGEQYFMSQLIDGDFAANNGGWQWSASTGCDGQPYFRIFNPITQGKRFDEAGQFIRRWLPELASVPDNYIHEPWRWSRFNTLTYPEPMVEHKQARLITLDWFKQAKDGE
ncbi:MULTISPECIES: deoxyribodipyrimidine photo-lyase [unclassified Vibrio]|uniref:Deoxyribodipyrimidine photo-lyase n=1 Tax=Vibrio sp. HB236076 TaxID=3232307 RepID=A0AB39HLD2_9VIBR|nr:deoxyribodipyrimidine photo-lyase [Vibrio sp. HB161653]MDP5252629.1 deoxyribodipyrimidine photo-lyase [Vibrio sp. HB161653]